MFLHSLSDAIRREEIREDVRPFADPLKQLEAEFAQIDAAFARRGWSFSRRPVESLDGLADSISQANAHRLRSED